VPVTEEVAIKLIIRNELLLMPIFFKSATPRSAPQEEEERRGESRFVAQIPASFFSGALASDSASEEQEKEEYSPARSVLQHPLIGDGFSKNTKGEGREEDAAIACWKALLPWRALKEGGGRRTNIRRHMRDELLAASSRGSC